MLEAYSILKNGNLKLSEHFKVREFFCRDGSDPVFIDTELVEILEKIRTKFGKPVTITSGFRTAAYNATVAKAAKYSQHLYGKAADIQVQGISVEQVYAYADKLLAGRGVWASILPALGEQTAGCTWTCAKKRAGGGGDTNGDHPFRHHCRSGDADRRIDRKFKIQCGHGIQD